jgi:hypothetical protein
MKIEKDDVSTPMSIDRPIHDHEILLSFNDDDMGYAFDEWWNEQGFTAFQKFFETWET